jgi:hypothetical protein
MDEEMNFPNPVERHDLPVKKPVWPKVAVIAGVFLLLGTLFLPRILATRVGRRMVRARLESKFNAEVSLQDFHTSWFGGTTASQFWIKAADGHVVGFRSLRSDRLSLFKLLRGKFDLGNCAIDGLIVEYDFDTGDAGHPDTYQLITGAGPALAGAPPAALARVTGNITVTDGQLNLFRNRLDAEMRASLAQTHFANVMGKFDIPALDQPWHFTANGMVSVTGTGRGAPFRASGDICLGKNGVMSPADISVQAKATGTGVPSDLAAVLCSVVDVQDCHGAFGDEFDRVDVEVNGSGGLITLNVKDASSARAQVAVAPKFDLRNTPAAVSLDAASSNTITCAMPHGAIGTAVTGVNPLISGAEDATLVLHLTDVEVPLSRTQWVFGTAHGTLQVRDVKWPEVAGVTTDLVMQLAAMTDATVTGRSLQCKAEPLELSGGVVTIGATPMQWGDAAVTLSGTCSVDGQLNLTAGVKSAKLAQIVGAKAMPSGGLAMAIRGTDAHPQLDMDSMMRKLPAEVAAKLQDWLNNQAAMAQRRDSETQQREKEKQVQDLVKQFSPDHPTTSVSGN